MSWAKLDDRFADHPRARCLSDGAFRLLVSAIVWASRHATDGIVPERELSAMLPNLGSKPAPKLTAIVSELTLFRDKIGRESAQGKAWFRRKNGAYEIVGFLDYNPSKVEIEQRRAAERERKRAQRAGRLSRPVSHRDDPRDSASPDPTRPVPSPVKRTDAGRAVLLSAPPAALIEALSRAGFALGGLARPSTVQMVKGWGAAGVTPEIVSQAISEAVKTNAGLPNTPAYLAPIVQRIMEKNRKPDIDWEEDIDG